MDYSLLEWACTLIALIAVLYRVIGPLKNKATPGAIALTIYFLASFLSYAVGLKVISPHLALLAGFDNITIILSHALVIVLTAAQQVVLAYWAYPLRVARRRAVHRIAAFGGALAFLIVLFLWIHPDRRAGTSETSSLLNLRNPYYATYLGFFIAVVAVGQIAMLVDALRYAKKTSHRPSLRIGMATVALGSTLIGVYCISRYVQIIEVISGGGGEPWNSIQWVAGDVGSLLELLGWTAPSWGPWARNNYYYHRLRPLWMAMRPVTPGMVLPPPSFWLASLIRPISVEYLLYCRLIDILDSQLLLRPYFDQAIATAAGRYAANRGLADSKREAAILAIQLHAALAAKRTNNQLSDGISGAHEINDDLAAEIRKAVILAKAFVRTRSITPVLIEAAYRSGPQL